MPSSLPSLAAQRTAARQSSTGGGERMLRRESVIDAQAPKARAPRELTRDPVVEIDVAQHPASAMQEHNGRGRSRDAGIIKADPHRPALAGDRSLLDVRHGRGTGAPEDVKLLEREPSLGGREVVDGWADPSAVDGVDHRGRAAGRGAPRPARTAATGDPSCIDAHAASTGSVHSVPHERDLRPRRSGRGGRLEGAVLRGRATLRRAFLRAGDERFDRSVDCSPEGSSEL